MYCPSCRGEFREGFTWCQDCGVALVEALPDELSEEVEEPDEGEKEVVVEDRAPRILSEKVLRSRELLLVLFVCWAQPVFTSIYHLVHGEVTRNSVTGLSGVIRVIDAVAKIALLVYVLSRQGRGLRQLGLTAERPDILPTLLLTIVHFLVNFLFGVRVPPAQLNLAGFPVLAILFASLLLGITLLLSAAAEELIVRAYLITEVVELTGQVPLAVLASACLQGLYHLYQGPFRAMVATVTFLVCSVYYVKTRRITPVILSHFFYNLLISGTAFLR
jgi:membrane protease YdiL (CAAX protease family)